MGGDQATADWRRESSTQGLTRRELGIAGQVLQALYDERDGFARERSSRQGCRSWSILVIRFFWLHSLLCFAFLSVAAEAEEGAAIPRYILQEVYNTQPPNDGNAGAQTLPTSGSASSGGLTPYANLTFPPSDSPSSEHHRNPSPSPAPNHAIDNNSTAPPGSAPTTKSRFNSEEKAGIILASFAALLQVIVVTYLLAKRRQMLGMVCDYDPPERAWENPTFSRA